MNHHQQSEPLQQAPEPYPRKPNRTLLISSGVVLGAWVVFLLLAAFRYV